MYLLVMMERPATFDSLYLNSQPMSTYNRCYPADQAMLNIVIPSPYNYKLILEIHKPEKSNFIRKIDLLGASNKMD
jgi:hypothetical protein